MLKVKLIVVGGANEGDEFQVRLPSTLGRARNATIPLPHPLVSREHCELIEKGDALVVRDLGSTNGTFVGSERVDREAVVEHGSLLTIGTVTFRAYYEGLPQFEGAPVFEGAAVHQHSGGDQDTSRITKFDTGNVGQTQAPVPHIRVGQKAK